MIRDEFWMANVSASPGVASREVAIIFDLSPPEAVEVLQGLAEKGKLSQEKGQYYPPLSSRTDDTSVAGLPTEPPLDRRKNIKERSEANAS